MIEVVVLMQPSSAVDLRVRIQVSRVVATGGISVYIPPPPKKKKNQIPGYATDSECSFSYVAKYFDKLALYLALGGWAYFIADTLC